MATEPAHFRHCSTCKQPIAFEGEYFRCSVSTCNRRVTALYFCSVPCWDAHVPEARHRDAWAEPVRAPSLRDWLADHSGEEDDDLDEGAQRQTVPSPGTAVPDPPRRRVVAPDERDDLPRDVLIVVSKLKAYVKARSGLNTSDGVADVLSDQVRRLCDAAIRRAREDGRKTLMDRDF